MIAIVVGNFSWKADGIVPITCSTDGIQSIFLRWWYKKYTQVVR